MCVVIAGFLECCSCFRCGELASATLDQGNNVSNRKVNFRDATLRGIAVGALVGVWLFSCRAEF